MGASGYRDHIVVCGWNSTARELIAELDGDDYDRKIVLIHEADKNPGGPGVYFVNGDVTSSDDIRRAVEQYVPDARVLATDAHDWNADEFSRGTWMAYRPGQLMRFHSAFQETDAKDAVGDGPRGARELQRRDRLAT